MSRGPPRWLMDTGSGWDLVCKADCHKSVKAAPSDVTVSLDTANGAITIDKKVDPQVTKLKENIEPLLLGSTPPVLTGRRCMDHGYSFVWPNAKSLISFALMANV